VKYSYTSLFKRSFDNLADARAKKRIKRALKKLCENPHAPFPRGMRVHTLKGVIGTARNEGEPAPPVWEMHAGGGLLVTFQYEEQEILFRNCGWHDDVLRNP